FYDSAEEAHSTYIEVSSKTDQWQYVSGSAVAPCDYTKIEYRLFYYAGKNSVIFDNAQMLKAGFGTMYEYDEKGLLIRQQDYDGNTAVYSYNEDDLVEDITYTRVGYSVPVTEHYEYNGNGDVNRHVDADGTVTVYVYDEEGNLTGTETTDGNVSLPEGTFEKENTNYVSSYTDDTGRTLRFTFDEDRGLLTKTTDPQNQETLYYYDAGDNLIKKQKGNSYTEYAYENGKPVTVRYNTDNGTVEYHLEYDSFGNVESISVGNQEIVSYEYLPYNDKLHKKTYSNGDCIEYVYDSAGNLTEVRENGQTAYRWNYTQSGKTGIVTDRNNDVTTRYEYRDDGWIDREVRSDGTTIDYTFNGADTVLLSKTVRKDDMVSETSYQYDSNDRVQSVVWDDTVKQNVRDGFGRVTQQQASENGSEVYTAVIVYADKDSTHTTNRMESYTNKRNGTVTSSFSYVYDDSGRIEIIRDRYNGKREYVYDSLGQLTEETNEEEGVRCEYTYDSGGNILLTKTYSLRTNQLLDTDTYTYGNGNRKDQLTSFNGNGIVYDSAGNPITYYDGKQFGYRTGRQLETITDGSLQVRYSYNENGIRTKK
ncbi:MAG: RHS repeat protein, partial [Erysipelotrichaceae bacterium]|nr:RHS repeat protein [Erysipelotrichaceae bacterium]